MIFRRLLHALGMASMDKDFNAVIKTCLDYGPRSTIPVEQRWREQFPTATDAEISAWAAKCKEIKDYAYARAEEMLDGNLSQAEASGMIGKRFPELNQDARSSVFSWALYMSK